MHNHKLSWVEYYISAYIATFGFEELKKIKSFPCTSYIQKLKLYIHGSKFNVMYVAAILSYWIGLALRLGLLMDDAQILLGINNANYGHSTNRFVASVAKSRIMSIATIGSPSVTALNLMNTTDGLGSFNSSTVPNDVMNVKQAIALTRSTSFYDPHTGTNIGRILIIVSMTAIQCFYHFT